jgi:hypothetical protein
MVPAVPWLLVLGPGLLAGPLALDAAGRHRLAALRSPPATLRLESPDFRPDELLRAAAVWQHGCARLGTPQLPAVRVDGPGVPVTVRRVADSTSPNGRCGRTRLRLLAGRLLAAEIDVFARQRGGTSCFPLLDEVAHELGHVFGLPDGTTHQLGTMMGPRGAGTRRAPTAVECRAAARSLEAEDRSVLADAGVEPVSAPLAPGAPTARPR